MSERCRTRTGRVRGARTSAEQRAGLEEITFSAHQVHVIYLEHRPGPLKDYTHVIRIVGEEWNGRTKSPRFARVFIQYT